MAADVSLNYNTAFIDHLKEHVMYVVYMRSSETRILTPYDKDRK